jgi:hypothetical protein
MIYVVKKRAGVWTVATDKFVLSFENYDAAIEVAQGAACVLRHRGRAELDRPLQVESRSKSVRDEGMPRHILGPRA